MKKSLLIAGGSGLIGTALMKEAHRQNWAVTILSRHTGSGRVVWDPDTAKIDFQQHETFDAIINLAGAPVTEGRWTQKKKKEIYDSRINAGRTIEKYIQDGLLGTSFYLGVSGIGIYGNRGNEIVTEKTPILHPEDWFIKTTIDWESAHHRIADLGIRSVILRTAIVLSKDGGALKEILSTPGFGVLSYFGHGDQIWSWIHIDDFVKLVFFCIEHTGIQGTYLATSPHPVSNKILTKTLNQFLSPKRMVMGVPKIGMSILLGETHRILFESCYASSEKIQSEGFHFAYPEIESALENLMKQKFK
ncbi:MAG: TIGR01777 family oxidoreductase [Saprospiraceae bacterium]